MKKIVLVLLVGVFLLSSSLFGMESPSTQSKFYVGLKTGLIVGTHTSFDGMVVTAVIKEVGQNFNEHSVQCDMESSGGRPSTCPVYEVVEELKRRVLQFEAELFGS